MGELIDAAFNPAPVPKDPWPWIEATQHKLTTRGQHRRSAAVNLIHAAARRFRRLQCCVMVSDHDTPLTAGLRFERE